MEVYIIIFSSRSPVSFATYEEALKLGLLYSEMVLVVFTTGVEVFQVEWLIAAGEPMTKCCGRGK